MRGQEKMQTGVRCVQLVVLYPWKPLVVCEVNMRWNGGKGLNVHQS